MTHGCMNMVWAALLALLLCACDMDTYDLVIYPEAGPDRGVGEAGPKFDGWISEGGGGDAADACVKDPRGEVCDNKDNDCNGKVDDVDTSTLQSNLKHCGACDNACNLANAYAKCVAGKCAIDVCAAGYHDVNKQDSDGCEYMCVTSNGGVEDCDGLDNDCDGKKDEDFNLTSNLKHCGSCNNVCDFPQATGSCVLGTCTLGTCASGYKDLDGLAATGCEYKCPTWPPEITDDCDGLDSDCDGTIDEDFAGAACGSSTGECKQGKYTCVGGYKKCTGATVATKELCNNKDDDCDGQIDETFDKLNDPRYCGGCTACSLMNALASCKNGVCTIAACKNGYVDLDKKASNGCEYGCTITGPEICDGKDNDCDGLTDGADPSMIMPTGSFCATAGACKGAKVTCQGSDGWVCSYSASVELKTCKTSADCGGYGVCVSGVCPGVIASEETLCDDLDNDCDGVADESFKNKGKPCAESGKQGICQGTGTYACTAAQNSTACTITKPGKAASNELCNGVDDDCDGQVDEEADDAKFKGVIDDMRYISRSYGGKSYKFYIYTYEASRPDAAAASAGSTKTRSCSRLGVMPWTNVTYTEAEAACKASGKRLCSPTEWYLACSGTNGRAYPYGNTYSASACNGKDYFSGKDAVTTTGAASGCKSYDSVMDLSGNLREWTDDPSAGGSSPEQVRGGAYDTISYGLACDFSFVVMPKAFKYLNLGFRCCSDAAP